MNYVNKSLLIRLLTGNEKIIKVDFTLHMILKDDYHYRTDISTGQQKNSFQYLGLLP